MPRSPLPGAFYKATPQGLPPPNVNIVYILESQVHLACYVGSTDNAFGWLRQHNAKRVAVKTAWTEDWVMKTCVMGFMVGRECRAYAYMVETAFAAQARVVTYLVL